MALIIIDEAQVLSNTIKQKRKEKAGKWDVPLPKIFFQPNRLVAAASYFVH
jgi:hypothetical protein